MSRLVLVPYLQHWSGSELQLRLLLIPRGISPLVPLASGAPNFASAKFVLEVHVLTANELPLPGGSPFTTISADVVSTATAVFQALASKFPIDPTLPSSASPTGIRVKKHLPLSYQKAVAYAPGGSDLLYTDNTYLCTIKSQNIPYKYTPLPPPNPKVSWGRVIATLLRNSALAEAAGLIRTLSITIPAATLKSGGFIFLTLAPSSDAAQLIPNGLTFYAARIPPLTTSSQDIFTPVLFPVVSPAPTADYTEIFSEIEDYHDGFAKAVHCAQPQQLDPLSEVPDGSRPVKEIGIRIGWDDEQVAMWMNRQFDTTFDSPVGVSGYRVDARISGSTPWISLVLATGSFSILGVTLPDFNRELGVEVHPVQLEAKFSGDFWLPTYFTAWSGPTLASFDSNLTQLSGGSTTTKPITGVVPHIALTYGNEYQFRVRLMDHTGGGPIATRAPTVAGPSPVATIKFKRWIRPLAPLLLTSVADPTNPPSSLSVKRPLLQYPSIVCTGLSNAVDGLIADIPAAKAAGREPGLPDPDANQVQITIEVGALAQDPAATDGIFMPLDSIITTRPFPADSRAPLVIDLQWVDQWDVSTLPVSPSGPLVLPTARLVRLRIAALCEDKPSYFGADDVRVGPTTMVSLRQNSSDEKSIFADDLPSHRFSAFFFQPDCPIDTTVLFGQQAAGLNGIRPTDIAENAAAAFGLRNNGLTFHSPQPKPLGRRIYFGCASSLRDTIGPDGASITFSSQADLALRWIILIRLTVNRDWSWDGFAFNGISVQRDGAEVGRFSPGRNVGNDAFVPSPDRTQTDLVFFDAIDPKPQPGTFPQELNPRYRITSTFKGSPTKDPPLELLIHLPVTTPPLQVPRLVSAGIALSPYKRATDYSSTEVRKRALWIELAEPPADHRDQYFARVLRNAPDPLLSLLGETVPVTTDPKLAIDPEEVIQIMEGEVDTRAGLTAMQPLVPSDSPLFWSLPLPSGLEDNSPELFGFFTYELRVGHSNMWSTAQGRFGPPLRVAGVQHPPPPLLCTVYRNNKAVIVSAPYALPVLDGVSVQPIIPNSTIWVLLYAQAAQIDGADKRNVLLDLAKATHSERQRRPSFAYGDAEFSESAITSQLLALGFASETSLSVLAVELLPQDGAGVEKPLESDLGGQRILRTSPLTRVPSLCPAAK